MADETKLQPTPQDTSSQPEVQVPATAPQGNTQKDNGMPAASIAIPSVANAVPHPITTGIPKVGDANVFVQSVHGDMINPNTRMTYRTEGITKVAAVDSWDMLQFRAGKLRVAE